MSSFGGARTTTTITADGVERRADAFLEPFNRARPPAEVLPADVVTDLREYRSFFAFEVGTWQRAADGATGMVLNHIANDVIILLDRVLDADGRSAARAARALFESLVTLREVTATRDAAKRYLEHRHVTADQLYRRRLGVDLLSGGERTDERRRLHRLGADATAPLAAAIKQYGKGFRRQWNDRSLYDAAVAHDLADGYDGYRILSGVMHSSAGSLLGTRLEDDEGRVVHRVGADYDLAVIAFLEGMRWTRAIVEYLQLHAEPIGHAPTLAEATDFVIAHYPTIRRVLTEESRRLWPEHDLGGQVAVFAIYPRGERWYMLDTRVDSIVVADPPDPEPPGLDHVRDKYADYNPAAYGGRPMTALIQGVTVRAHDDAIPTPSGAILVPEESFGTASQSWRRA